MNRDWKLIIMQAKAEALGREYTYLFGGKRRGNFSFSLSVWVSVCVFGGSIYEWVWARAKKLEIKTKDIWRKRAFILWAGSTWDNEQEERFLEWSALRSIKCTLSSQQRRLSQLTSLLKLIPKCTIPYWLSASVIFSLNE